MGELQEGSLTSVPANRKETLLFTREHINKNMEWSNQVIFSGESKFDLSGPDGQITVWQQSNKVMGGKNASYSEVWQGPCYGLGLYVGPTSGWASLHWWNNGYLQILWNNLKKSTENMGMGDYFRFYQDKGPVHTSYIVQLWLLYNCPKVVNPPPQSSDVNPKGNLWDALEKNIQKVPIQSKQDVRRQLPEERANLSISYLHKLVESVAKWLTQVLQSCGGITKH